LAEFAKRLGEFGVVARVVGQTDAGDRRFPSLSDGFHARAGSAGMGDDATAAEIK
jgi:hypothetical protein